MMTLLLNNTVQQTGAGGHVCFLLLKIVLRDLK